MRSMYLKCGRKNVNVVVLESFFERLKGLKFYLEQFNYIIKFPKKKFISTYFMCQNVDIVITDKDDKVVKVYEKVKPEKIIFPKRYGYNVYFMPLGFGEKFKHNEKIKLKENNS